MSGDRLPVKELRIGLVLYGGVSLAVYMNGIVTELWHLLRASQPGARGHATRGASESRGPLTGSAGCYRDLIDALQEKQGAPHLQVVVDAVAGTSAGGLGGAALAKAVVEGADPTVLNKIWIEDADIARLKGEPVPLPFWPRVGLAALTVVALAGRARRAVGRALQSLPAPLVEGARRAREAAWRVLARSPQPLARAGIWLKRVLGGASSIVVVPLRRIEALPGIGAGWLYKIAYTVVATRDGRVTPLDGRYFTRMIAKSFEKMSGGGGDPLLPKGGTFDLCLTSTDLFGWPRHLPVSPGLHSRTLYEGTHAHAIAFRHRPYDGEPGLLDDFALTVASRSTAGFPFAFAPVCYGDIAADFRAARADRNVTPLSEFAERHLREHELAGFPVEAAWMVDGGFLDNKPFSYVAEAIEDKPAEHEVHRTVIYIEPDPEPAPTAQLHEETGIALPPSEPPWLGGMVGPVFSLFRHEPILGDLRALDGRNAKVRWLRRIRKANRDTALELAKKLATQNGMGWPPEIDELDRWRRLANDEVRRFELSGYPGYVAHKARRAAEEFAGLVCRALNYPYHSRQGFFVRNVVRGWLEGEKALDPPAFQKGKSGSGYRLSKRQRELLGAFDLSFRLRRIRALVQTVNEAYAEPDSRAAIDACKEQLADVAFELECAFHAETAMAEVRRCLDADDVHRRVRKQGFDSAARIEEAIEEYGPRVGGLYEALGKQLRAIGAAQNKVLPKALAELPAKARGMAAKELAVFPFVDLALFPLMDMAEVGDLITIDTMRISPSDATRLCSDPKRLKGWRLGAFAGFLDRRDREHDLLWGRLDGAERLIALVIAAAVPPAARGDEARASALEALREDYTVRAMRAILDEAADSGMADLAAELRTRLD